jgi:hypothetical protein
MIFRHVGAITTMTTTTTTPPAKATMATFDVWIASHQLSHNLAIINPGEFYSSKGPDSHNPNKIKKKVNLHRKSDIPKVTQLRRIELYGDESQ